MTSSANWRAIVVLGAAAAGCHTGPAVEPTPLRGPQPGALVVWPFVDAGEGAAGGALLAGLDGAARARGYRVPSLDVGRTLLLDAVGAPRWFHEVDPSAVGRLLDVDAFLVLDVRRFAAEGGDRLRAAGWDLRWRLLSARGAGELWAFEHAGSWQLPRSDEDPLRRLDAEPEIVMIGGDRTPAFRDVAELMSWLHRHAMAHLPSLPR